MFIPKTTRLNLILNKGWILVNVFIPKTTRLNLMLNKGWILCLFPPPLLPLLAAALSGQEQECSAQDQIISTTGKCHFACSTCFFCLFVSDLFTQCGDDNESEYVFGMMMKIGKW